MPAIAPGAVLKDRYRLERLLGRGGMAAVWLGHDDVLDRPVAVKVLSDTIASDPDFLARFRREATVAAGLSHPNLVGVYDYSESGERPYLVMEFVRGEALGALISRDAWIDRDELARELLGAVAHIHAAGIVHRDIKPHNILLDEDGTAKLIDFGIALPPDATSLTQTGMILATKRYAAPEVMDGRPATKRSDLYSCGVVLRACGGGGSTELRALVDRLTRTDPESRPYSAREAMSQLEIPADRGTATEAFQPTAAQEQGERGAEPDSQSFDAAPTRVYSRSASKRNRWLAGAAIIGVIAAIAVAVVVATDTGGSTAAKRTANIAFGKSSSRPNGEAGGTVAAAPTAEEAAGEAAAEEAEGEPAAEEAAPAEEAEEAAPAEEATPAAVPVPAGSDPELAAALNQEGFELIRAGRYAEAVPILEESVRAFPPGTEDTNYAYALFNLGDALRRSGRPEDAIPVLEQRLLIPNQTDVVRRELDAAQSEAG